jgi:hypothetical protein
MWSEQAEPEVMRNSPRFALVPLAALFAALPLVALSSPAGADTVADCQQAFSSGVASQLVYTTDPPTRLAFTGQTVSLSAAWDPAAWDSLSSAAACVRLDDDIFDATLGTSQANPANGGAFSHSFTIPQVAAQTRLCTRIRLSGDPAGEATEATWVTKMHCFEVDQDVEETPPDDTTPPAAQPPAGSEAPPGDTPAAEVSAAPPLSSEGGDAPVGAPFDSPATPAGEPAVPGIATTPEPLPLLPATGYATPWLLHQGVGVLLTGVGLLVSCGRPRRRRHLA